MEIEERENLDKQIDNIENHNGLFGKIMRNVLLIVIGTIIVAIFLRVVQTRTSMSKQQENHELALTEAVSLLERADENTKELTGIYHSGNWQTLEDIREMFARGTFNKLVEADNSVRSEVFAEIAARAGVSYLYLLDEKGTILVSPDAELQGWNPAATAHMTQENLNRILNWCYDEDGNVSPVFVMNMYGTYYFYSMPMMYNGVQYVLAIGHNSVMLDQHASSLSDVSNVLSRTKVINDGFLFAVNKEDMIFEYYNNGEDLLTGQNVFAVGLKEDVLKDGYKGTQDILEETYYCTSKTLGDNMVIVAAARLNEVVSHDKYVLLWSVMGFCIVMVLCLAYAIIVKNDYIRQGINKEKSILFKGAPEQKYFDKAVFRRVLPLMMIGVLSVYGITFYMQTLLEIEEGVDKAKVILQEVSARYEEGAESRDVVQDYFNSRFLSIADLASFIVGETPEVMNANTDHYHTVYDEDGVRRFVLDDEGNPLRSIAEAPFLQELCQSNLIDAIYIFNEEGYTIATSTKNWFFSLSKDENDQSYPFRQVLDGKTDSYLQEAMVNDLGEDTQFFGVAMYYYTTLDENGETKYVSRYAFEEACAAENVSGVRTAGGITKHRSLLQIELNENLAGMIMETTSTEYAMSTKVLSDGAVLVFDSSPEHKCVYSPNPVNLGRSAEELGISSKAFSGNVYYGFNKLNGNTYFEYFRYLDENYYVAAAIPKSSMYQTRTMISLITAAVCLVLVLNLLLTATVSDVEQTPYEEMLAKQHQEDKNSTIFSIILPSGRIASTTKALARWDNRRIPWNERSTEMKLGTVLGWILLIPVLYFVFSALGINRISAEDSVIRYILSNGWDKSPNVFAFSACVMTLATVSIGINLLNIPVRMLTNLLGTRGETVGHLLLSIVKYGGTIGVLFYCLYLFGIDSANLLASAGIMSIIIGLGAQSLIKDIIAGIFIVFEGEFRVGDIVTIGGFRGTVTDIGLRTTKISGGGNIKIFNNSDISGVLNMTKETSYASVTVSLDYTQDVDYVTEVLDRELKLLKDRNPKIVTGPSSLGVSGLNDRQYTVTVVAGCNEKDVAATNRYLNKAILEIFKENGIQKAVSIPVAAIPMDQLDAIKGEGAEKR